MEIFNREFVVFKDEKIGVLKIAKNQLPRLTSLPSKKKGLIDKFYYVMILEPQLTHEKLIESKTSFSQWLEKCSHSSSLAAPATLKDFFRQSTLNCHEKQYGNRTEIVEYTNHLGFNNFSMLPTKKNVGKNYQFSSRYTISHDEKNYRSPFQNTLLMLAACSWKLRKKNIEKSLQHVSYFRFVTRHQTSFDYSKPRGKGK